VKLELEKTISKLTTKIEKVESDYKRESNALKEHFKSEMEESQ